MNQSDELREAIAKLVARWRRAIEDSIVSGKPCDPESVADCADELEELAAARQAAESPGPAPEREQWANNVANLIQLGARDGESLSAELHRMEKVLLTYYPRAERSLAEVSEDENGMLPCPFCGGEAYKTESVNGSNMVYVGCSPCGIAFKAQKDCTNGILTKDIVAAWNQRKGTFYCCNMFWDTGLKCPYCER
jgi:hypothetical protein